VVRFSDYVPDSKRKRLTFAELPALAGRRGRDWHDSRISWRCLRKELAGSPHIQDSLVSGRAQGVCEPLSKQGGLRLAGVIAKRPMELMKLEMFVAAVEEGSVRAAAESVYRMQPA